jgi:hypothetical protein
MSLRRTVIAALLGATALAPLPALAREHDRPEDSADAVADKLRDPGSQIAVAAMLSSMSQALLDMRIGPFVEAMDKAGVGGEDMRDLPPDARLGDVAGRRTREMPGKIAREAPRMMGSAAGMADALKDMMPQLREMGRKMKQSIPRY